MQTSRLTTFQTTLSSVLEDFTYEASAAEELETRMSMLKEYLQGLACPPTPTVDFPPGFGFGIGIGDDKHVDDGITSVKKEIRGVKGLLLSARSFPGGVRAR